MPLYIFVLWLKLGFARTILVQADSHSLCIDNAISESVVNHGVMLTQTKLLGDTTIRTRLFQWQLLPVEIPESIHSDLVLLS